MIRVATSAAYLPLMPPLLPKASAHLLCFKSCLRLPDLRDANGFRAPRLPKNRLGMLACRFWVGSQFVEVKDCRRSLADGWKGISGRWARSLGQILLLILMAYVVPRDAGSPPVYHIKSWLRCSARVLQPVNIITPWVNTFRHNQASSGHEWVCLGQLAPWEGSNIASPLSLLLYWDSVSPSSPIPTPLYFPHPADICRSAS